ncbi:MAG: helix-turn-helix transcriptional regulator [Pseudomonadota bacterium]
MSASPHYASIKNRTRNWRRFVATAIGIAIVLQVFCALFFTADAVMDLFLLTALTPDAQFFLGFEMFAVLCLWLGVYLGARQLWQLRARNQVVEDQLKTARGAFHDLMMERFSDWHLTPSERDVALLILKGMTTAEVAALRGAAEGTVKSQSSAIYRKAGVANRAQLISSFIEELTDQAEEYREQRGGADANVVPFAKAAS